MSVSDLVTRHQDDYQSALSAWRDTRLCSERVFHQAWCAHQHQRYLDSVLHPMTAFIRLHYPNTGVNRLTHNG
jgi:hypothetical protein